VDGIEGLFGGSKVSQSTTASDEGGLSDELFWINHVVQLILIHFHQIEIFESPPNDFA